MTTARDRPGAWLSPAALRANAAPPAAKAPANNCLLAKGIWASCSNGLLQLVQLREQLVVGDQLFGIVEDLLEANRSRLVDNHIGALGITIEPALRIGVEKAVGLEGRPRKIADQREGEAHLVADLERGRRQERRERQQCGRLDQRPSHTPHGAPPRR